MSKEYMLRMRIEQAAKDAERAVKNKDELAYNRACARYHTADRQLRMLETARNERIVRELEARAIGGVLPYAAIMRAGVPIEVLKARGWSNIDGQAGMRKVKADATATSSGAADSGEAGPQAHES